MVTTYSNRFQNTNDPSLIGYEFEVLNTLKDLSSRSDANVKQHTRFLFESDTLPLKDQCKLLTEVQSYVTRAVFSGSKSLHVIVQVADEHEDICAKAYKHVWKAMNELLFRNSADSACANPSRLTRRPRSHTSRHTKTAENVDK